MTASWIPLLILRSILFLHGLNGHPKHTWEHEKTGFYWPAQLRRDIPGARVMTYGYNADFERGLLQNKTTIKAVAEMLVSRLVDVREEDLVRYVERKRKVTT